MSKNKYIIGTLGSHSALQILKGAKDEGFRTLIVSNDRSIVSTFISVKKLRFSDESIPSLSSEGKGPP